MPHQNACLSACLLLNLCLFFHPAHAQVAADKPTALSPEKTAPLSSAKPTALSSKYAATVDGKISKFDQQTETYTRHTLDRMIQTEKRMQAKLSAIDAPQADRLFGYAIDSLQRMKAGLPAAAAKAGRLINGSYFAYADTLRQTLAFLQRSTGQVDALEGRLNQISTIQNFVQQRMQVLNSVAAKYSQCLGNLQQLNKTAFYYSAQMAQYRLMLKNPATIERKMLDLVEQSPAFQDLMQNKGRLAGLFAPRSVFSSLPLTGAATPASELASRATMQQYIKKNMPLMSDTADPLSQLQPKFTAAGNQLHASGSASAFTPNTQHTRSFGQRIVWGLDLQFGKAVSYLPTTANIGVTAGYRLNDRFTAGIGIDYLMGMGTGWKDIHLSHQGVGLRSFAKWEIKKGWNIQGGAESNYLTAFNSISQLRALPNWQTSALLGISKQYRVSRKISGNFQVLYDFLYRQHLPNTQPILFRLGYDLK